MKKLIALFILAGAFAFTVEQASVKGKLVNGSIVEIINTKGELVYGNTTASEVAVTIKSFDVFFAIGKVQLTVSTEKGGNTLTQADISAINQNKGARAIVKNITGTDNSGKEVKLPEIAFFIQ